MDNYYSIESLREAEKSEVKRYPENFLMQRAGLFVAHHTVSFLQKNSIVQTQLSALLLVGSGGNGGDALYAGVHLLKNNMKVQALAIDPQNTHEEARNAFLQAGGQFLVPSQLESQPSTLLSPYNVVIDGISGLSGTGVLRAPFDALMPYITCPIISIDMPSDIVPHTGVKTSKTPVSTMTVTFGALKAAHILGRKYCGHIELMTFSPDFIDSLKAPAYQSFSTKDMEKWPIPSEESDKYSGGVLGIAAGSPQYPGAAVLAVGGAITATSSMVRYLGANTAEIISRWPEAVTSSTLEETGRVNAWLVGPGSQSDRLLDIFLHIIENKIPCVIDAEGLNFLAHHQDLLKTICASTTAILTPHYGEFQRLFSSDLSTESVHGRCQTVQQTANALGCTIVLKGNSTIIASPNTVTALSVAPTPWAATPGSGDVLAGIMGALLAAGVHPHICANMAAWAHSRAAQLASVDLVDPNIIHNLFSSTMTGFLPGAPIHASKIIEFLPNVIKNARLMAHSPAVF